MLIRAVTGLAGGVIFHRLVTAGDRWFSRCPKLIRRPILFLIELSTFLCFWFFFLLVGRKLLPEESSSWMDGFLSVIGPWVVLVVSFVLALLASRVLRLAARMSIGVDKVAGKGVEVVKGGTRTVGKVVEAGAKQAKSGVERGVATARSVVSAGSKHTVLLGNATISRMKAWNRAGVARLKEAAKRSKGVLGRFRRKT